MAALSSTPSVTSYTTTKNKLYTIATIIVRVFNYRAGQKNWVKWG